MNRINIIAKDDALEAFRKYFEKIKEKETKNFLWGIEVILGESDWMPENSFMMISDREVLLVKDGKVYKAKLDPVFSSRMYDPETIKEIGEEKDFSVEDYINRLRWDVLDIPRVIRPNRRPLRRRRS
jgi:hypothetical protein